MNEGKLLGGVDAGHVNTKAVIIRGEEILGYCTVPTGFDVLVAAQKHSIGALAMPKSCAMN
jgi:hypothetical protein